MIVIFDFKIFLLLFMVNKKLNILVIGFFFYYTQIFFYGFMFMAYLGYLLLRNCGLSIVLHIFTNELTESTTFFK
jgi:hypothetical protein